MAMLKKNLESVSSHLLGILSGKGQQSQAFLGKTLTINVKVGTLVFTGCGTGNAKSRFEANSVDQIVRDSYEQGDD